MTRLFRSKRRLALQAAVAALAAAMVPGAASAERSNDLSKKVVIVAGPEVGTSCATTDKLEAAITGTRLDIGDKHVKWAASFERIHINPKADPCGSVRIDAYSLENAAALLSKQLETYSATKPVDVVALGTGGTVLRYAMLMSARKRAGLRSFGEVLFANRLDIEDAVTLGSALDGAAIAPASCGGGQLCADLVRPPAHEQKPIWWQLMDSPEQDGRNPQGVDGTDWSVIGIAADRFAEPDTSTGMDANHKTIYEDPKLTFQKALVDGSTEHDAKLRFMHAPETEWTATTKGPHVLARIAQDLVYGVSTEQAKGEGPAYAEGCTGSNDDGATLIQNPQFSGWRGDKRAVRIIKAGTIEAIADCFKADPKKKDVYTVQGDVSRDDNSTIVRINGLDFVLKDYLSEIEINTKTRTLKRRSGTVSVELPVSGSRSLDLWTFTADNLTHDLEWKFPSSGDGPIQSDDGTVFSLGSPDLEIKGFEVSGEISMNVIEGGIQLDLSLALPGIFSNNLSPSGPPQCGNGRDDDKDGEVDKADEDCEGDSTNDHEDKSAASGIGGTIGTSNKTGLQIDKLNFSVGGTLRFGPFRTQGSIGVAYDRKPNEWKFELEASLPALADVGMKLKVGIRDGELSSIYGELNGLSIPLWSSGWYAQKIGLGLSGLTQGDQLEILISVGVSFLRKIAGEYMVYIDGDLTVGWGAPWKFGLAGSFEIAGDRYGSGSISYEQNVGGELELTLGREIPIGEEAQFIPQGTLKGTMGITGELDIGASIQACFKGKFSIKEFEEPYCIAKTDMRLTRYLNQPVSQAVCFKTSMKLGGEISIGFVTTYDIDPKAGFKSDIDFIAGGCDVDDYGAKKSQVAGETGGFTIAPGTKQRVIKINGVGSQAPNVVLVAPDGRRIATPAEPVKQVDDTTFVLGGLGGATTFVLAEPPAGQWKVEPQEGSSAVASIDQLAVLPEPKVSAKVVRERRGFELRYDVAKAEGQTVRFVERRKGLIDEIGHTTGGAGRFRFDPAFGPAGKREIVAIIEQDGRQRRELVTGSYVAPAPAKPGKVKTVTVKRTGKSVTVRWSKALRATGGYEVVVRLPDGRTQAQITKTRKVVLHDVLVDGKTEVTVRALRKQDETGGPKKVVRARV